MGSCVSRPRRKFDKEKPAQPKTSKTKSRSSKEPGKELTENKNVRSKKPTSSGSHLDEDVSIEDMVKIYPENMGNQLNKKLRKEQTQPQLVSKVYQTVAVTSVLKTLPSISCQNFSGNTEPYIYLPSNTNLRKIESPIKNNYFKDSNTQTTLSSGLKATLPSAKSHSINIENKNIRPSFNMYESSDIPASKLLEVKIIDNPNEQVSPRQCVVNVDNLPQKSYPSIHRASDVHDSFSIIQEKSTRPQSLIDIAKPFSDKIILNPTEATKKPKRNVEKIEPTVRDMPGVQMTYLAHSTTLSKPRYFCEPAQSSSQIHEFKLRENDNLSSVNSHFLPTIQAIPNVAHSTSISISPNICEAVEYYEGFIEEPFDAIWKQNRDAVTSCISNKEAIELPVNSIVPAAAAQVSISDILQGIQQRKQQQGTQQGKPQQQNLDVLNQTQSHSAYGLPYPYTNDVKPLKDTTEDSRISAVNKIEESVPKKEVLIKVNISKIKQEEKPYEQTITHTKQLIHTAEDYRISPVTKIKESEKEVPIELTISETKQQEKPYDQTITDTNIKSLSGYETSRGHIEDPNCSLEKEQIPFKGNDKGKPQKQNLGIPNQSETYSVYNSQYSYINDVKQLIDTAEDSRVSAINKIEESVPKEEVLIKVKISKTKQEEKPYEQTITHTKQLMRTAEDSRISPVTKIKESEKEVPAELTITETKQEEKPYEQTITDTNIKSLSGYETPRYHIEDPNCSVEKEQISFKGNDKGKPQKQNLGVPNQSETHSDYNSQYSYINDVKQLIDTAEDSRVSAINKIEESVPKEEVLIKVNISKTKQEEKPYEQTIPHTKQLMRTAEDSRISPVTKIKESEKEVPIELTISETKQEENPYEKTITDTNIKSLSGYETPRYHKEDPNCSLEKEQIPFKGNDKGKSQKQNLGIPNQSETYSAYNSQYPYINDVKQLIDTAEDSRISAINKIEESVPKKEGLIKVNISKTKQEEKPYEQTITHTKQLIHTAEDSRISPVTKIKESEKEVPIELTISETKQEEKPYERTIAHTKQLIHTAEDSRISPVTKIKESEKEVPIELTISETKQEEKPYERTIAHTKQLIHTAEDSRISPVTKIKESEKEVPIELTISETKQEEKPYEQTITHTKQLIHTAEDFRISPVTKIKESEKKVPIELTISETKQEEKPYEQTITHTKQLIHTAEDFRISPVTEIKESEKEVPIELTISETKQEEKPYEQSITHIKQLIHTAEYSRISPVTKIKESEKEVPIELTISETKQEENSYEKTIIDTNIKSLSGYEAPRYHKEDPNCSTEKEQIPFKGNDKGKPQQQHLGIPNQSQTYSAYSYINDVKQLIDTAEDSRISPVTKIKESERELPIELTISETKQEENPYKKTITDTNIKSLSGYETPRYHKEDPNCSLEKEQIPFKRNNKGQPQQQHLGIPNQSQTYSAYSYINDVKQLIDTAEDSRISPVTKMKENEKEEIPSELAISETNQEEKPHEKTSIDTEENLLSGYETERYHKEDTNLQSIQDGDILEFNPIEYVSLKAILNKAREENSHEYPQQTMSASLYSNENNEIYLTEVQNTPKNKVKENENIPILKKTSVENSYEYSQQMISSASSTYSHELIFADPIIKSSQEEDTNKPNSKQTYQEESFEIRTKQHDENHNGISTFSRDSGKNFKEFVSGMLNESGYDYYNSDIVCEDQNWQQYHDNSDESNAYQEEYQKFDNKEIHCEKSGDDNDSDLLLFSGNQPLIQDNTATKEDITLSSTRLLRGLCVLDKEAVEIQQDDRIGPEKKDETNAQTTQERVKGEPQTVDETLAYDNELFWPQVSNERQLTKQEVNICKPPTTQENNNILPEFTLEIAPQDEPEPHQRTEHNERHVKHQISQQVNNSGSQGYIDSELNLVIAPQDELESHQPTEDNESHLRLLLDAGTGNQISQQLYNSVICSLDEIKRKAEPFEEEIRNFTELEDSDKHYYIEESLRRLIDKLDDMFDDIGNVKLLREERKKVYGFIFPMFERLDEKVKENRERKKW